jgi:sigma-B regulation protein RsbU (phosphoserine phosphatase)
LNISDPSEVLGDLSTRLHAVLPPGHFVAIWYGVIDIRRNILRWAASTFLPQLYSERAETGFGPLPGEGFPLGFMAESHYTTYCRPFCPGARLILYSDALAETPLPPVSVFTLSSLCEFVNGLKAESSASYIANALIERLDLPHNPLLDDLTLVTLFRNQSEV